MSLSNCPILYQNQDQTITLLDIPFSIAAAQDASSQPPTSRIYSAPAAQKPYPSTEPKSAKARANVLRRKAESGEIIEVPVNLLLDALADVRRNHEGEWCLERLTYPQEQTKRSKKRKSSVDHVDSTSPTCSDFDGHAEISLLEREETFHSTSTPSNENISLTACADESGIRIPTKITRLSNALIHNPQSHTMSLQYEGPCHFANETYQIPPRASFFISKINEITALTWSMAALELYPEQSATAGPAQFDFILLDPPWENRSVKNGRFYDTVRDEDPLDTLKTMLEQHISPEGFVACWITNKAGVRSIALEMFEAWGVRLVEEWLWLKITMHGEPVTEINGLWRRPYETLLVGKKGGESARARPNGILRRIIIAVPDLHSRKPNLKSLIEPMMPVDYRALEIFGRNLTSGWLTWGDECLKYAWEGHWSNIDRDEVSPR